MGNGRGKLKNTSTTQLALAGRPGFALGGKTPPQKILSGGAQKHFASRYRRTSGPPAGSYFSPNLAARHWITSGHKVK